MSEARQIDQEPNQPPELSAVPSTEPIGPSQKELEDTFFMAAEFDVILQTHEDYHRSQNEEERARLVPDLAHTFIRQKVTRRFGSVPPLVQAGTLHSVMFNIMKKYHLGAHLDPSAEAEREVFMDQYEREALEFVLPGQDTTHPDIFVADLLYKHAEGLGRTDIAQAVRTLLAAYGKAIEDFRNAGQHGLRHIAPPDTVK